jgi:lipoprotein-releasing system ATP-binding protein
MAIENKILLEAKQIKKSYKITKEYSLQVLKGIDLYINKGEIAAIVGKSGAGKSTLLHILGTLDTPDSGELLFDSKSVFSYGRQSLADFRNKKIGFIFQFHHLLPEFTVL